MISIWFHNTGVFSLNIFSLLYLIVFKVLPASWGINNLLLTAELPRFQHHVLQCGSCLGIYT